MKNWTHDTIDELRQNYTESDTDLTTFFLNKFSFYEDELIKAKKARDILNEFEQKGLIKWKVGKRQLDVKGQPAHYEYDTGNREDFPFDHYVPWKSQFATDGPQQRETLRNNRIEARLTIDGLDYAIKLRRERWQYRIFLFTAIATAFFTGAAAVYSAMNYYKKQEIINVKILNTKETTTQPLPPITPKQLGQPSTPQNLPAQNEKKKK